MATSTRLLAKSVRLATSPRPPIIHSLPKQSQSHRLFTTTRSTRLAANDQDPESDNPMPDGLATRSAKGQTGGDEPLDSTSRNAPPKPKISNMSVPGGGGDPAARNMTEEQKKEVEEHNRDFDKKHDRGERAPGDKVDKNFWKRDG